MTVAQKTHCVRAIVALSPLRKLEEKKGSQR